MPFQRKDIHIDAPTTDGIYHAVLIGDSTAPFSLEVTLQRLRLTKTGKWMLFNVSKQVCDALHDGKITRLLPVITVFLGFFQQDYFHKSSIAMGW